MHIEELVKANYFKHTILISTCPLISFFSFSGFLFLDFCIPLDFASKKKRKRNSYFNLQKHDSNLWGVGVGGPGGGKPRRKGAGGRRREGRKQDSQSKVAGEIETKLQHFLIFCNRNGTKRREPLQKGLGRGRFRN